MKKLGLWLLALVMALGMVAFGVSCSGGSGGSGDDDDTTDDDTDDDIDDDTDDDVDDDTDDDIDDDTDDDVDDDTDDDTDDDIGDVPNAPSDLTAEGQNEDISLDWQDNSDNEDGFYVYRRPAGSGSFAKIVELEADATSYTDINLGLDRDFEYKVTAFNDYGESEPSNIARAQTTPNAPTDLEVSDVKKYQATLSWTDNSSVEEGYKVERQLGTKAWQQIADLPADTEEYTDTTLECDGAEYEYQVKAYNGAGDSDYSNTDDATTLDCWTTSTIDSDGNVGEYTSIAIDSNDKVHVSYFDAINEVLRYATNSSRGWQKTIVDSSGGVGKWTSIALDSSDNVHISYYYLTDGDLKYATNTSRSWQTFTVDSTGDVGKYTSIAIDSSGKVHISYYDYTNSKIKYATNTSGSWQTFAIDSAGHEDGYTSGRTSITLDSSNNVHISYYDYTSRKIKYATNTSRGWQTFAIDSAGTEGGDTSIAIDSSDKVHISYLEYANLDIKYATNKNGSWQTFIIDDSVTYLSGDTSIAVDSSDNVHISYYYSTTSKPKYATNTSGSWQTFIIDSVGFTGEWTSIALDSSDKVHISYYDNDVEYDLRYATTAEIE